ncbi:PAS domain-containing sensor histidine kinase [Maribacter polysiphoniae]|uniref:histidine kinase n=1 Tax=Maribacter polysiphoniae TaxID=429344 RepID=A0A316DV35_9FLAO|nr:PAS domain-containing sensor histidine kinase [Maribacter polysiphoniae]MBD1262590.1 PAS domain-containing sensor histidine kinase [Maribacter polysiphoniae]PWK21212.1 PAS domain S-box-containing protein [Maribacter polysiphoniae]
MNSQLAPFFDLSMDCLCIANYEGYFVNINPALVELLGYSETELKSRLISEFIYEEDRERTAKNRQNLLKDVALVNFENRYVCKSGELVWLHWTSIPVASEQLVYAIAKDVTHKKELENERISHLSQLSQVNNELKQLNYTTSHDLRSPVNNLISMVDLIDMGKIEDDDTLEILSFIRLSAEGLKTSLNTYIDAFKQNDDTSDKFEVVTFNTVLQKVQSTISSLIRTAGVEFQVNFSGMESILFNAAYMESIMLNFITNSIKYARPHVPPVISITSEEKDGKKTFTFSDNGLGFDMEKVGHLIFNLNQRFHGNEDSKGVGLYLVYNHVTSLGGTISVDSAVNEGTTFTITFKA